MGIDACDLRGNIRSNAQGATTELVGEFESEQIQILTQAYQQRFGELHQRRNNQAVPPAAVQIQKCPAQRLHRFRLAGKHLLHTIRKLPVIYCRHLMYPALMHPI